MAVRRPIVQALNNLPSNVARHTSDLSRIRIEAAPEGACVAVSVCDEGGRVLRSIGRR